MLTALETLSLSLRFDVSFEIRSFPGIEKSAMSSILNLPFQNEKYHIFDYCPASNDIGERLFLVTFGASLSQRIGNAYNRFLF